MENPIKLKCHKCKDNLTEKEQERYLRSNRVGKPTCYQCNMEIIEEQRSRWGAAQ
jgi:hypothetical protein